MFDEFLSQKIISEDRYQKYRSLEKSLQEFYQDKKTIRIGNISVNVRRSFSLKDIDHQVLDDYWAFLMSGHHYSLNTMTAVFNRLRTFFNWCITTGRLVKSPLRGYNVPTELYGTPVIMTLDEVDAIWNADLSKRPLLEQQRDIFVFQCCIGCRVSDLLKLKRSSIIHGAIEYIPRKTKSVNPVTVRVPLNSRALQIISKYQDPAHRAKDYWDRPLLPFISRQKYNVAIKRIFRICGMNRMVTVMEASTREEIKKPLYEVASSHLARRTFIGNIYNKVQDPNLISSMTGHVEGSKAFARYRVVDDHIKKKLVRILDERAHA